MKQKLVPFFFFLLSFDLCLALFEVADLSSLVLVLSLDSSSSSDCSDHLRLSPLSLKHCDNADVDKATCTASPASTSLQTESTQDNENLECLYFMKCS